MEQLRQIYGDDVRKEPDGTFTLSLAPWTDMMVKGFVSEEDALRAAFAIDEASTAQVRNAMADD